MNRAIVIGVALVTNCLAVGQPGEELPTRIPVVLDTDIGTDIDDAFALALALATPELELLGVTTVSADAYTRARIVCRFLESVGHADIPVASGRPARKSPALDGQYQYGLRPSRKRPLRQAAVEFILEQIRKRPGQITLICVADLTNVAELITKNPEAKRWIKQIVIMGGAVRVGYNNKPPIAREWNIRSDVRAAQTVFASGIPLIVAPLDATASAKLTEPLRQRIFGTETPLCRCLHTLYELWGKKTPVLFDPVAVTLAFDESFCRMERLRLVVDDEGYTREVSGPPNCRVAMGIKAREYLDWYVNRVRQATLTSDELSRFPEEPTNVSYPVPRGAMPYRVHVVEDYETDIERRWWLAGKVIADDVPPASTRACEAVLCRDFDGKMGDPNKIYRAVVFNPVPGPPMGSKTRLSFSYHLSGTDRIRVQLYSLSKNYHRHLTLTDLPQGTWQSATVDMTAARRPDGSGGPLGKDERIDDIQFYVGSDAALRVDNIVLYEAARANEDHPFPRRIIFTAWFDTGNQGQEWPGNFEIVPHPEPQKWCAAKSVENPETQRTWIRVHMRGLRRLGERTSLRFRYRLTGSRHLQVALGNSGTGNKLKVPVRVPVLGKWAQTIIDFKIPGKNGSQDRQADEILFMVKSGSSLLIDDVLLYEPAEPADNSGPSSGGMIRTLRNLDVTVLSKDESQQLDGMISRDVERRRLLAIQRENAAWSKVKSRHDWERFRDQRLNALRESLGQFPPPPKDLKIETTGRIEGDGYRIENIVFESRPGLLVTANLYLPDTPRESMPAVLFSHSHHNPKTQGELQDMGITWARHGWLVMVMDLLGHGERRQHPFVSSDQYPEPFRVGRQDYYFRYNLGLQLQLVGESLMGWIVWDLMRGVDLLCSREDVDRDRIVLVGSVAGGGDPAAVAAAFDRRIAAVAPFNFGGPQPDYPIPQEAEKEFYYFGVAYWETTRCLRLGGRDGFAHWVIAASVAPRGLIYSHEFAWDRARDPVWPRLEKVFGFYNASDRLAVATGQGHLKGRPPESTHCNNVGVVHRRQLYPHLALWFNMQPPAEEFQNRHDVNDLPCITPGITERRNPQPVYELAGRLANDHIGKVRKDLASMDPASRRKILCDGWSRLLGNITPTVDPIVKALERQETNGVVVERIVLEVEPGIIVPLVLMQTGNERSDRLPVVIALADSGKQEFLAARPEAVSAWLETGCAVCLPDLRGFGETSEGGSYGPRSIGTTLSCRDQVLGQTLLGSRLRDLRSVLLFLRSRGDLDENIALWGDSLAALNPPERSEVVPHGVDNPNVQAEPSAGLLVLLTALFEDNVNAVYARGTFASFRSLLDSPFLYVPHDSLAPGALTVSDVADIASALVPRPLLVECPVDGLNRRVPSETVAEAFAPTSRAYRLANASEQFTLNVTAQHDSAVRLLDQIKRRFQK